MTNSAIKIAYSRSEESKWEKQGLRGFLEYRDLGVVDVTEGRFGANIGRALHAFRPGGEAPMHTHVIGFHFMYVLKGWVRSYYEGLGEVVLKAGDSVTYEGENVQAHLEYSEDYEVLQVAMPANFETRPSQKQLPAAPTHDA